MRLWSTACSWRISIQNYRINMRAEYAAVHLSTVKMTIFRLRWALFLWQDCGTCKLWGFKDLQCVCISKEDFLNEKWIIGSVLLKLFMKRRNDAWNLKFFAGMAGYIAAFQPTVICIGKLVFCKERENNCIETIFDTALKGEAMRSSSYKSIFWF